MKYILITGGAGFIGTNLIEKLIQDSNNFIYIIDNFYTGSLNNIKQYITCNRFKIINHDIIQPIDFTNFFKINEIYHLACPASPKHYQKDPLFTAKTCFLGTLNVIEVAKHFNSRILFSSTSEVYGNPLISPQKESYLGNVNCFGPRSVYDEGKRIAETLLYEYKQEGGDIRIARIFNTYGPKMDIDDGRVVSNFIVQALQEKDITIYGNGKYTRSFQFVSDLVDGLIKLMANNTYSFAVNIGNPSEFTIEELAHKILKITNSKSKIIYLPSVEDDPTQRKPDITLAKNILNWTPNIKLEDGLNTTILYFKNLLKI